MAAASPWAIRSAMTALIVTALITTVSIVDVDHRAACRGAPFGQQRTRLTMIIERWS